MEQTELYWLTRNPNMFCPPHINPEIEIVYVKHGTLGVTYDSFEMELHAGQMTLILPYHLHSFIPTDESDAVIYMFPQTIYHDFTDYNNNGTCPACKICTLEKPVAAYIEYLLDNFPPKYDMFYLRSLFYAFANVYLQETKAPDISNVQEKNFPMVIEYIFSHLEQDISVGEIAKFIGWEPRQLSCEFKKKYGIKITDLISNIRIERAATLLETTDINISEVASGCGFGSLRNFNRIFRMRLGCTPSNYRLQHQK